MEVCWVKAAPPLAALQLEQHGGDDLLGHSLKEWPFSVQKPQQFDLLHNPDECPNCWQLKHLIILKWSTWWQPTSKKSRPQPRRRAVGTLTTKCSLSGNLDLRRVTNLIWGRKVDLNASLSTFLMRRSSMKRFSMIILGTSKTFIRGWILLGSEQLRVFEEAIVFFMTETTIWKKHQQ